MYCSYQGYGNYPPQGGGNQGYPPPGNTGYPPASAPPPATAPYPQGGGGYQQPAGYTPVTQESYVGRSEGYPAATGQAQVPPVGEKYVVPPGAATGN